MLWYDKLQKVPEPGSLQEFIAQIVMLSQKEGEHTRWLILYQILDKEKSFDHLELETIMRQTTLPYTQDKVHEARKRLKGVIEDFIKQGPMLLTPEAIVGSEQMRNDPSRAPGVSNMGLSPRRPGGEKR